MASGNVIFDTPAEESHALERRIEQHLQQALGYAVATFVRSAAELATPAAFQPFPLLEGRTVHVGFLAAPPDSEAARRVLALQTPSDQLLIQGRELYWLCHTRVSESTLSGARLERALGMPTTLRNITTVRKLAAKYGGEHGFATEATEFFRLCGLGGSVDLP